MRHGICEKRPYVNQCAGQRKMALSLIHSKLVAMRIFYKFCAFLKCFLTAQIVWRTAQG
jgi:hypothetical protein